MHRLPITTRSYLSPFPHILWPRPSPWQYRRQCPQPLAFSSCAAQAHQNDDKSDDNNKAKAKAKAIHRPGRQPPLPPRPKLADSAIRYVALKGSGPGGQAINKTNSAIQMTHIPTGIVVKSQATRSKSQNYKIARRILAERVEVAEAEAAAVKAGGEGGGAVEEEEDNDDDGPKVTTAIPTTRAAAVQARKRAKKKSAEKKKRRKYRRLAEEKGTAEAEDETETTR